MCGIMKTHVTEDAMFQCLFYIPHLNEESITWPAERQTLDSCPFSLSVFFCVLAIAITRLHLPVYMSCSSHSPTFSVFFGLRYKTACSERSHAMSKKGFPQNHKPDWKSITRPTECEKGILTLSHSLALRVLCSRVMNGKSLKRRKLRLSKRSSYLFQYDSLVSIVLWCQSAIVKFSSYFHGENQTLIQ